LKYILIWGHLFPILLLYTNIQWNENNKSIISFRGITPTASRCWLLASQTAYSFRYSQHYPHLTIEVVVPLYKY